ncbi:hypothetical protein ACSWYU_004704 [Vibrio harveyi]
MMIYDVFRLNNGCDLEVHSKVTTVFVQKSLKALLILGVIISLDLTGHSLRAKSGLSAEMGTKPLYGAPYQGTTFCLDAFGGDFEFVVAKQGSVTFDVLHKTFSEAQNEKRIDINGLSYATKGYNTSLEKLLK